MSKNDDLIDASIEGRTAFREGKQTTDCPYEEGTPWRRHWMAGYSLAEEAAKRKI